MPTAAKKRKFTPQPSNDENKIDSLYSWYKWSDCEIAKRYDEERNFYPQPGPSNLNYYEDDDLTGYYRPVEPSKIAKTPTTKSTQKRRGHQTFDTGDRRRSLRKTKLRTLNEEEAESSPIMNGSPGSGDEDSDWENDIHVQSFYEQSFVQKTPESCDSPISNGSMCNGQSVNGKNRNRKQETSQNTPLSTPVMSKLLENLKNSSSEVKTRRKRNADACTIRPSEKAPDHRAVKKLLNSDEFPSVVHPVPYYSDPNDIIAENAKKEVGHTVLQLKGNAVNDCEEFKSQLDVLGMTKWQGLAAKVSVRSSQRIRDSKMLVNENSVRKCLARKRGVRITPKETPPSKKLVQDWLNIRSKTYQTRRSSARLKSIRGDGDHEDSPVKVRREKPISILNQSVDSIEINDEDENGEDIQSNCLKNNNINDRLVKGLLANTQITVRITKRPTKQIPNSQPNNIHLNDIIDISTDDDCNDDNDDVVCLDKKIPSKNHNFGKLVCFEE